MNQQQIYARTQELNAAVTSAWREAVSAEKAKQQDERAQLQAECGTAGHIFVTHLTALTRGCAFCGAAEAEQKAVG